MENISGHPAMTVMSMVSEWVGNWGTFWPAAVAAMAAVAVSMLPATAYCR
jgi:hypothetical protein